MAFSSFLTDNVEVFRLSSTLDRETYSSNGFIDCQIQASSREMSILSGGAYGKTFNLYADADVDLIPTDKVIFGTITLYVRNMRILDIGNHPHIEAVLTETLSG